MPRSSILGNAPTPLALPTYEGSGQCVHPDVVVVGRTFFPHEYLMVVEPYPYGDDTCENPSILGSDDGVTWVVPTGTSNPVVSPPAEAGGWNSDADLLNQRGATLWLYYRFNSGRGETTLLRKRMGGGGAWSEPEPVFTEPVSGRFASPGLVEIDGVAHMFYVDTLDCSVGVLASPDGERWGQRRTLFSFPGAWHLDATIRGQWVYILLNDADSLRLLRTRDLDTWWMLGDGHEGRGGWMGLPSRGEDLPPPLIAVAPGKWDDRRIYRGSCLVDEGHIRVWYSALSSRNTWHVGYVSGEVDA